MKLTFIFALHEVRVNIHNYRLPAAALILAVLIAISLTTLAKDYRNRLSDQAVLKQSDIPLLELQRPSPLGIFASGLQEELQAPYRINEFKQISAGDTQKSVDPLFGAFAPPDTVYIIKVILTLMAVFFAYDTISAEREQGTLRTCLAGAVPRRAFVTGKMIGSYISLALPTFLLLILGFAAIATLPDIHFTGEEVLRFMLFVVAAMLFLAVFISLGTAVSVIAKSSSRSLVMLIGLWILITYFIPSLTASMANAASPLPPAAEIDREMNSIWAGGIFRLLNLHDDGSFTGMERRESNQSILKRTRNIESGYFAKVDRQIELTQVLGHLSPATAFTDLSTSLLKTGLQDLQYFRRLLLQRRNTIDSDDKSITQVNNPGRSLTRALAGTTFDIRGLLLITAALILAVIILFNKSDLL